MSLRAVHKTQVSPARQEAEVEYPAFDVNLESVSRMYCPVCKQKMNTSLVKALSEGRCPACGENVIVHGKIGSYHVLRMLGHGGMGVVYEGFDEGLGRKVAIKVTQVDVTQNKEMLSSFQREAQVVARLNHPNVVQVYAFGEEKGHPYLVMELLSSGSLMDLIKEDEPLSEAFLMGVTFEIAEGLKAAQDAGLLHGDIKPENILFDEKMHAKLVDFGIAAMQVSKTSHEVWGTPYYIAPEKVVERKSNHKCDIYSLGATLYHAFAKRPPFNGADPIVVIRAAIDGKADPLSNIRPAINPEVEAIINRMMEKDTALRYPNYKSIMSDVKKYLSTVPRERLRRTSRIVVSAPKKIKKPNQKLVPENPFSTSSIVTASQSLENAVPNQSKGFFKTYRVKILLLSGCLSLLGTAIFCNNHCKNEDKNALYLQAWSIEKQYNKVFRDMDDSLKDLDEIYKDAQGVTTSLRAKRAAGTVAVAAGLKQDEELESYKKQFETLLQDAVVLRNQAEMAKFEPSKQEDVDNSYLARLEKGLEAQNAYTTAIKKKADDAERLLAEVMLKGDAIDPASTNSQKSAQIAKGPIIKDELASGSGKGGAIIDLGKEQGLQNFRMEEGDSLIIAMWNPQPGMEGGGEVSKLCITRTEGGRAYIAGLTCNTGLGDLFKKGLTRRSKFPAIERVETPQPGSTEGEFSVPSMGGITFRFSKESNAWKLDAPRVRRKHNPEKMEGAPAFVFKMRRDGTYSLTGQLVLRAPTPKTSIIWMIWTAKIEEVPSKTL